MQEKRRFARAIIGGRAWLELGDQRMEVELANLSLKGAQVIFPAKNHLGKGAEVRLIIQMDDSDLKFDLKCRLAHLEADLQAGLEFLPMDVTTMQHLRRLVELNLDDGEELTRFDD